jgi:CRP-like cAMP-binding protein
MSMDERTVAAGTVIYREGDPGDAVYFIRSGQVEISKLAGKSLVRLVTLGKGDLMGEMSVVRDEPRSTTARAVADTELMALSKEQFLAAFGGKDGLALRILRTLCERLAQADRQLMAGARSQNVEVESVKRSEVAAIRLRADSDPLRRQIGADAITIDAFPFQIGRQMKGDKTATLSKTGLSLRTLEDHHLSPQHFAIDVQDDVLVVRDLGSDLGTLVNGRRISHFEPESAVPLSLGINEVVTGGEDSPFKFVIELQPKKKASR